MRAKPDEGWPVFVCLWAKCQRMCCVCLSRHRGRRHAEGRRRLGGGRNQHGTAVRWVTLQGRYSALLTRGIERCLPEPSVKTPVTPKREGLMLTCAENRSLCFTFPHSVHNLSVLEEPPPLHGKKVFWGWLTVLLLCLGLPYLNQRSEHKGALHVVQIKALLMRDFGLYQ